MPAVSSTFRMLWYSLHAGEVQLSVANSLHPMWSWSCVTALPWLHSNKCKPSPTIQEPHTLCFNSVTSAARVLDVHTGAPGIARSKQGLASANQRVSHQLYIGMHPANPPCISAYASSCPLVRSCPRTGTWATFLLYTAPSRQPCGAAEQHAAQQQAHTPHTRGRSTCS